MRTLGWNEVFEYEYSVQGWASCWLFRSALEGETLFSSLDAVGDWLKKGSYHTAWSVPWDSSCTCSYAYGHGPAIGPRSGERCWPLLAGVWRAIALLMKPWCAEEDVPTAANLNLYRGRNSCVRCHCDDTSFFTVRAPVWNRSRLTLRSVGLSSTLYPVHCGRE